MNYRDYLQRIGALQGKIPAITAPASSGFQPAGTSEMGNPMALNPSTNEGLVYQDGGWQSTRTGGTFGQPIQPDPVPIGYEARGVGDFGTPIAYHPVTGDQLRYYPGQGWVSTRTGMPVPSTPPGMANAGTTATGDRAVRDEQGNLVRWDPQTRTYVRMEQDPSIVGGEGRRATPR